MLSHYSKAQVVFWAEDFNNGCTSNCLAGSYSGTNGAWTVAATGTNGNVANEFFISCAENGMPVGTCGAGCGNNATLHVGSVPCQLCLTCPNGDCGAAYNAGPTFLGDNPVTNKRAESPVISTIGKSNITLEFNYIEQGQGTTDDASVVYSSDGGTTWNLLANMAKTNNGNCSGQGYWTAYSVQLPVACENIANLKIGFEWKNNSDGAGSDPSFAVDEVELSAPVNQIPVAAFSVNNQVICINDCIDFTDASTGSPANWQWTFTGAVPSVSTNQNPTNICYNTTGIYDVELIVSNANGSDTIFQQAYITVNGCYVPQAAFTVSDSVLCEKECVDFFDLTTNTPVAWQWTFQGASPDTSTLQNPTGICYNQYGTYAVTLSVINASGSDTLAISTYITVNPDPPAPVITAFGTVLNSTPAVSYQWYFNNQVISGAVNQVYIGTQPGDYYVIITDSNGCEAASNLITLTNASLSENNGTEIIKAYPNPAFSTINISLPQAITSDDFSIAVVNSLGEKFQVPFEIVNLKSEIVIDINQLQKGIYFLEIIDGIKKYYSNFVK